MKISDLGDELVVMRQNLTGDYSIRPENVYQEGIPDNKKIIGNILEAHLLPGSRLVNAEALTDLWQRSLAGESCLILAEHYSNADYPILHRLMEKNPKLGTAAADSLLPLQGTKLSEDHPVVALFTQSYDTIVIHSSRLLDEIKDPKKRAEIRKTNGPLNHAAMREMVARKHNGRIILVFPAGTRYRSWQPDSGRGMREIYPYVKTFSNILFLAINGNAMPPDKFDKMIDDEISEDLVILTASSIVNGRDFKKEVDERCPKGQDPKIYLVEQVMTKLKEMHDRVEPERLAGKKLLLAREKKI